MVTEIEQIPKTYEEAVQLLARWHREDLPSMVAIWSYDDPARQVVRLVEVDEVIGTEGEIWTYPFGASERFPYRSEVALVSPEDHAALEAGGLNLPESWRDMKRRLVWTR